MFWHADDGCENLEIKAQGTNLMSTAVYLCRTKAKCVYYLEEIRGTVSTAPVAGAGSKHIPKSKQPPPLNST